MPFLSIPLRISCNIYIAINHHDRLCGLEARVPGYTTEMYCVSYEVRTEFIYVM
jgi:hypothetical protein